MKNIGHPMKEISWFDEERDKILYYCSGLLTGPVVDMDQDIYRIISVEVSNIVMVASLSR